MPAPCGVCWKNHLGFKEKRVEETGYKKRATENYKLFHVVALPNDTSCWEASVGQQSTKKNKTENDFRYFWPARFILRVIKAALGLFKCYWKDCALCNNRFFRNIYWLKPILKEHLQIHKEHLSISKGHVSISEKIVQ